jgi:3'(2'), 5'-bisphosphate nucleotidase
MIETLPANNNELMLKVAIDAALKAGSQIFAFQKSPSLGIRIKRDLTPVTRADRMAQEIISSALSAFPIPMISEEVGLPDWNQRKTSPLIWIVDPLDGTKEYIARRSEYTVNIALVKDSIPLLGVVYAPACGQLYYASAESGAFRVDGVPASAESFSRNWISENFRWNSIMTGLILSLSVART